MIGKVEGPGRLSGVFLPKLGGVEGISRQMFIRVTNDHTFLPLRTQQMTSTSREWQRGVSPRFSSLGDGT